MPDRPSNPALLVILSLAVPGLLPVIAHADPRSQVLYEDAKIIAPDGMPEDWFGAAVAISPEMRVVVGAYRDDDPLDNSGSAYVFERSTAYGWIAVAKLRPSDGAEGDAFGFPVSLSGDSLAIGAAQKGDPQIPRGEHVGAAYIFQRRAPDDWAEVAKVVASDRAPHDRFGEILSLSGGRLVVGASGHDHLGESSGAAYVFERTAAGRWLEVAELLAPDGEAEDYFGGSAAISGDSLVVGAWGDDDLGIRSGSAWVFERGESGEWIDVAKLLASDGSYPDEFGNWVSISGDALVVGASEDRDLGPRSGSAYVFERNETGAWEEVAKLLASDGSDGDRFGSWVSISGERVIVGAPWDDDIDTRSGSAYVFERDPTGSWLEVAKLQPSDGVGAEEFGKAVAISGRMAVVGSWWDRPHGYHSGSAYIFSLDSAGLASSAGHESAAAPPFTVAPGLRSRRGLPSP